MRLMKASKSKKIIASTPVDKGGEGSTYRQLASAFTYAGMLPFVYGALASLNAAPGIVWWPDWVTWPEAMFYYAAVIISFLAGIEWGRSLQTDLSKAASIILLINANGVAVAVWAIVLIMSQTQVAWALILLLGWLVLVDYLALRHQIQQAWFFTLRWQASLVAVLALGWVALSGSLT